MEDSSSSATQEEIVRLNKIISILVEQNEMLKAILAVAKFDNDPPFLIFV
jgi:hypothetical protein